jgi:hypothetical protein
MTTLVPGRRGPDPAGPVADRAPGPHARRGLALPSWTVPAAAAVAVLARLPYLGRPASPDEAGYLLVGAQWSGPGHSLYGDYFVDRPPLLVTLYRVAAELGGVPALRLMGCLAAVVVVLATARAAATLAGSAAGRWTAVLAAALTVSPLLGAQQVDGELLAAPFVAVGLACVVAALQPTTSPHRATWLAAGAGASGAAAALVKQNFVDVGVVVVVALAVAVVRHELDRRRALGLAGAAVAGGATVLGATALWTLVHGTSLLGVWQATYPFRLQAAQVIAASGRVHAQGRLDTLLVAGVVSLVVPAMLVLALDVVLRPRRDAVRWALVAAVVWATASALLGGAYWLHYLLCLVVPVAVSLGVVAARHDGIARLARGVVVAAALSGALAWGAGLHSHHADDRALVGSAVGRVAHRGDTIVSLYGGPDTVLASGLRSPYAQLWALPVRVLDPDLRDLQSVLTGPEAPTWLVTGHGVGGWGLRSGDLAAVVRRDYRPVADVCGRVVRLRDGVDRPVPVPDVPCRDTSSTATQEVRS